MHTIASVHHHDIHIAGFGDRFLRIFRWPRALLKSLAAMADMLRST